MSDYKKLIESKNVYLPVRPIQDILDVMAYDSDRWILGSPYFGVVLSVERSNTRPVNDRSEEINVTINTLSGNQFQSTLWARTFADCRKPSEDMIKYGIKTEQDSVFEYGMIHDLIKKMILAEYQQKEDTVRSIIIRIRQSFLHPNSVAVYKEYVYPEDIHFFCGSNENVLGADVIKSMKSKQYDNQLQLTIMAAHSMDWRINGKALDISCIGSEIASAG